jgi:glycosyltransferase involved in cell wall biosynthesis
MVCIFPGRSELPFSGEWIHLNRPIEKRFWDRKGWKKFARIIKEFQPDIIQANAGDTLKFAVFSKLFFGWKTPIVFRNANKVSDFVKSPVKRAFNKFLMRQVSYVISVSEVCRKDFIETYGWDQSKIATVPIGINAETDISRSGEIHSAFNSGRVLLHAGAFVLEKNHEGLIRIFEKVLKESSAIKLALAGDGKLRVAIEEMVKEKDLEEPVLFLGYQNDVFSLMKSSAAFLLPSKIEGLPGVILEAMYSKIPVIAYDVGGVSEVVKNGETGWLIKAGDEAGFANAVLEVLSSDHSIIIERAYEMVVREYDNREIAKRFLEVYKRVAGHQSPVSG